MDRVNEESTWITRVTFTDENGDPATPTYASYRIDDVESGTEILTDTEITSLSTYVDITWSATQTALLDQTHPYETRKLTVYWEYGDPTGYGTEEYLLQIKNLQGIT